MTRVLPNLKVIPQGNGSQHDASEHELRQWVETCFRATVRDWTQISGGNRCRSWLISLAPGLGAPEKVYLRYQPPREPSAEPYTVWREALIYRCLEQTDVRAPRLLAVHECYQAIITTAAEGRADYRRLTDPAQKAEIAEDFAVALAELHRHPFKELAGTGFPAPDTIGACVREELRTWQVMYEETDRGDPLIDLALKWLNSNLPEPKEAPVLVHGDAGPGNFLFEGSHMTGLVDWELAHPGDPIEDLAWFCMRSVMEPVPDFPAALTAYETASGRRIDVTRLLYHRVFVSLRVVVIRHRNVTGLPGNSIVSRSLNRRLLVDALAAAQGIALPPTDELPVSVTERTELYNDILVDLLSLSDAQSSDITDFAKNTAKVVKYLRQYDMIGREAEREAKRRIGDLLGKQFDRLPEALSCLSDAIRDDEIEFESSLQLFAALVRYEAQLAAPSSGRMALRGFPPITKET